MQSHSFRASTYEFWGDKIWPITEAFIFFPVFRGKSQENQMLISSARERERRRQRHKLEKEKEKEEGQRELEKLSSKGWKSSGKRGMQVQRCLQRVGVQTAFSSEHLTPEQETEGARRASSSHFQPVNCCQLAVCRGMGGLNEAERCGVYSQT